MRSSEPLSLPGSPLILVLAQVRFSAVLDMETYVPKVQEALRSRGFPRYAPIQSQGIQIGPMGIQQTMSIRWTFLDKDRENAVILHPDFLVLASSRYTTFEEFQGRLAIALSAVQGVASPALTERLGLRYVDLIVPGPDLSLQDCLAPGMQGLAVEQEGVTRRNFRFESVGSTTPGGQLSVRIHNLVAPPTFLPPDVDVTGLSLRLPPIPQGVQPFVLDFDHFVQPSEDFDTEVIARAMWQLHDFTDRAFRDSVTPKALAHWGAKSGAHAN